MQRLYNKIGFSLKHLLILDRVFYQHHRLYKTLVDQLNSPEYNEVMNGIEKQLYAGGKKKRRDDDPGLARQMILSDLVQYIFTGRAYYYATFSQKNLQRFLSLVLKVVNLFLIYDTITVDEKIRTRYIDALEAGIELTILYAKEGDQDVATSLKGKPLKIGEKEWSSSIDQFIDSILPKTLGNPKELVVFAELIRMQRGLVVPLLLLQKTFGLGEPIAPPDFLIIKPNKNVFGIEVGYEKEEQSREFAIRTSIPTIAIDLKNNLHNRCPKCGKIILYCDPVIEAFAKGSINDKIDSVTGKFLCYACPKFEDGGCIFSNYYGRPETTDFKGAKLKETTKYHFHAACLTDDKFKYRNKLYDVHSQKNAFFAQLPEIQGLENL